MDGKILYGKGNNDYSVYVIKDKKDLQEYKDDHQSHLSEEDLKKLETELKQ